MRLPNSSAPTRVAPEPGRPLPTLSPLDFVRRLIGAGWTVMLAWHATARQRRALAQLDDHLLRDLGLRRDDVAHEVDRPFWDVDRPF